MPPFNIAASAPAPAASGRKLPVDPALIALADAFDRIQKTQPALFAQLAGMLHAKLDAELRHVLRAPGTVIQVSQGRAQIADEILEVLDNCDAIARQQRQRQQSVTVPVPIAPPR